MTFPTDPVPLTVWREDHASPWQRLGAFLTDCLLLGIPLFVVFLLGTDWDTGIDDDLRISVDLWVYPVLAIIGFLYQVPPVAVWGKTLGKLIVGITICSGRDLGRPGWWRAVRRWGIFVLVGIVPVVGGLLSLLIPLPLLWTNNRQGFHDKVADTLVMRDYVVCWRS